MYKKYLENRITRYEGDYKCYLCQCVMKQSSDIVEEHLLSEKHQKRLNHIDEEKRKKETDKLQELKESQCKKIIRNSITFDRNTFFLNCHDCKCKIDGLLSALEHINVYSHTKNWTSRTKVISKPVAQKEQSISSKEITVSKVALGKSVHASMSVLPSELNNIVNDEHTNSKYCNTCKTKIIAKPNISHHAQRLLDQTLESKAKISSSKSDCIVNDEESKSYHCTTCKYKVDSTPDATHQIQGFLHQKAKSIIIVDGANQGILKSERASETQNVDNRNHNKVLEKIDDDSEFTEIWYCKLCQIYLKRQSVLKCHVLMHLYEELKSLKGIDLLKFELKPKNIVDLQCLLCNSVVCKTHIFYVDEILEKHLKSNMHLDRLHLFNSNTFDFLLPGMNEQISNIDLTNVMFKSKKDISLALLCNVCNVRLGWLNKQEHISGTNHKNKMLEAATSYTNAVEKTEFNSMKNFYCYTCLICDESFSDISNLIEHYKKLEHQSKIISLNMINKFPCMKFIKIEKLEVIECSLCRIIMHDLKTAIQHILENNHCDDMQLLLNNLNNQENVKPAPLAQAANEFERLNVTAQVIPRKLENDAGSTTNRCGSIIKSENLQNIEQNCKHEATLEEFNQSGFGTEKILDNPSQEVDLHKVESCFTKVNTCYLCDVSFNDVAVVQYHMMLHLIKEFELINELDILQCQFTANKVLYLQCTLCNYSKVSNMLQAHEFLDKHFKTKAHLEFLDFFKLVEKEPEIEDQEKQLDSSNVKSLTYISTSLMCNVCDVPIPFTKKNVDEHVLGKSHKTKLTNIGNNKIIETKSQFDINDYRYYKCFMCDQSFSDALSLVDHYKTAKHQWKIKALNMIKKCSFTKFLLSSNMEIFIWYSLCNKSLQNYISVIDHITSKEHIENLTSTNLGNQKNNTSVVQVEKKTEQLSLNPIKLVQKQENMAAEIQNLSVITNKNSKKIKTASNLEASVEELNQLGFSIENILIPQLNPDKKDNVLDSLISLDFDQTQTQRLPYLARTKIPRTPKIKNVRKSFAATLLENGRNYITFCIDSGLPNIYNFDDRKIGLLELGVNLTYPFHSNRVCFPCEKYFPDNVQSLFEHLQSKEHLKNICDLLIDDKGFEDYPDQFSHLRLAKLYMHVTEVGIQCHACNVQISDVDKIIRQHTEESVHKKTSEIWKEQSEQLFKQYHAIYKDIWYYAEVFFCEICKKRCEFEMDFVNHLMSLDHMKNKLKYQGISLTFYLCPSCITYWFGKTDSYEIHCESDFHKRFATNKDFMVPNLTVTATEFLNNIDENAAFLESESNKVIWETGTKESLLLKAIVETVKPTYPHAEAYLFGSRLSHSAFPDSDADVFLDCGDSYYTSSTREQSQEYIKLIKNHFRGAPNTWYVNEVLLGARVPILKLRHIPTNLECDLSFTNGLGVEKSSLIGFYSAAFPICRKLILFMKKWLKHCRIFGPEYITTFAISWCVIFYLQLKGILPTVHELIKLKKESKFVDGWQCGFVEMISAKSSKLTFKQHLNKFFHYFADFDYHKKVICPYLGEPVDKLKFVFEYTNLLPIEMDVYKNRLEKKEIEIFRFDSPMCIQDPIDHSQNITKAVKKRDLRCFRQYCILSAQKC